jgi:hypothetical protein
MSGPEHPLYGMSKDFIERAKIHASEYSWANTEFDMTIDNNKDVYNLYRQLTEIVK